MGVKDIRNNILNQTDSYNTSHQFFKVNTDWEVSHMYNRKAGMILYGMHETAVNLLTTKITHEMINEVVTQAFDQNLPFPELLFRRVVDELNGNIPILFEMLPEGTWCPAGTPFAQISNTVEGFGELVTWWEGVLMMAFFPSSCATEAFNIAKYLKEKGLPNTRFHSFGFRGHKSLEDAYWAGTAWALFFEGLDDFHIKSHLPNAKLGSIPALAHKVTQQFDDEYDCFIRAIDETAALGLPTVSLVIDTYDANRFVQKYLLDLANHALSKSVHIVARPDSGPVVQQTIDIFNIVKKNDLTNVSVIIGEGIDFETAKSYDRRLSAQGVPLSFVTYGIGAGFYKHLERDTLGWAMKTAYSNGKPRMKFSMVSLKRSIPGAVGIVREQGELIVKTFNEVKWEDNLYFPIYRCDGDMPKFAVPPDWDLTRRRVEEAYEHCEQKEIRLSESIHELIREFQKQYL
ncbi:putative nicotinate phosphoribosyltransferase [compost metagenome]